MDALFATIEPKLAEEIERAASPEIIRNIIDTTVNFEQFALGDLFKFI